MGSVYATIRGIVRKQEMEKQIYGKHKYRNKRRYRG